MGCAWNSVSGWRCEWDGSKTGLPAIFSVEEIGGQFLNKAMAGDELKELAALG